MISGVRKFRALVKDEDGASAIEAAVVFPILIGCLFTVFGLGTYMYGSHAAQRTVEETAREVRMVDMPTKETLYAMLKENTGSAPFGTYTPTVTMKSQFDGSYAELNIDYNFQIDVPFLNYLKLKSVARTEVKLRDKPV